MNNDYESALRNSFFHKGFLVYNGDLIRTDYSYHDGVITVQEAGIQPIALSPYWK